MNRNQLSISVSKNGIGAIPSFVENFRHNTESRNLLTAFALDRNWL